MKISKSFYFLHYIPIYIHPPPPPPTTTTYLPTTKRYTSFFFFLLQNKILTKLKKIENFGKKKGTVTLPGLIE
jgi:hypothetical protein